MNRKEVIRNAAGEPFMLMNGLTKEFSYIAVDPGTTESAFVVLTGELPNHFGKVGNEDMLTILNQHKRHCGRMVIEMVASYGKPVGETTFETCLWIGRFIQAWGGADYSKVK